MYNNEEKHKNYIQILRISKKIKSIEYLGGCCSNCKESNIFKLCFHHTNPDNKNFDIGDLINFAKRWSDIQNELDKCILLCRNCHGEVHHKETDNTWSKNNKRLFIKIKGMNGCEMCGYNKCLSCLDFHHENNDKIFGIGTIKIRFKNISEIQEEISNEINKCKVVCKNCHSIIHSDVEFYEEHKDIIMEKVHNLRTIKNKIDKNEIIEYYKNGITKNYQLSKIFNVSRSTMRYRLKRLKISGEI